MEYLILIFVVVAVVILMFGLVLAVDMNKLINKENCSEGNTSGNWTRLKVKGEL